MNISRPSTIPRAPVCHLTRYVKEMRDLPEPVRKAVLDEARTIPVSATSYNALTQHRDFVLQWFARAYSATEREALRKQWAIVLATSAQLGWVPDPSYSSLIALERQLAEKYWGERPDT